MSRVPRKFLVMESVSFHILNRGNGKMTIFHDDRDRQRFKERLIEYKNDHDMMVYNWGFLPNHFHLAVELPDPIQLSDAMARWLGGYSRYFRRKYNTAGHVWQGRFKSQPVQTESYLLKLGRYIERNAMRAGLVERPWDYEWSSCKYYAFGIEDGLTDMNPLYEAISKDLDARRKFYMKWLMVGEEDEFRGAEGFVGDENFVNKLRQISGRLVPRKRGRPKK